jgi:hypothetical protein
MSTKRTSSTISPLAPTLAPNQSHNIASDLHGLSNEPATKRQFLRFENSRPAGKCHTAEILIDIQDIIDPETYEKVSTEGSTFDFVKYIQSLEKELWEYKILEIKRLADQGPPRHEHDVDKLYAFYLNRLIAYDLNGVGYEYIHKKCMQGKTKKGKMTYNNDFLPFSLGECGEILTPCPELEKISCPNQKAVMTCLKYGDFEAFYEAWLSASGVNYDSIGIQRKLIIHHAPFLEWNRPFIQTKTRLSEYELQQSHHRAWMRVRALEKVDEMRREMAYNRLYYRDRYSY